MSTPSTRVDSHSADVRIHLHLNGSILPVAQLGPSFLILRNPIDHPSCYAEITLSIDGKEERWAVHLTGGIQIGRWKTAITPCSHTDG